MSSSSDSLDQLNRSRDLDDYPSTHLERPSSNTSGLNLSPSPIVLSENHDFQQNSVRSDTLNVGSLSVDNSEQLNTGFSNHNNSDQALEQAIQNLENLFTKSIKFSATSGIEDARNIIEKRKADRAEVNIDSLTHEEFTKWSKIHSKKFIAPSSCDKNANEATVIVFQSRDPHIPPQADESYRKYKDSLVERAGLEVRADYYKQLVSEKKYPAWSVKYKPPMNLVTNQQTAEKLVQTRRETSMTMINCNIELIKSRIEELKIENDVHLSALRSYYQSHGGGYYDSLPTALDFVAKNTVKESNVMYQSYNKKYAALFANPEGALWDDLPDHITRPQGVYPLRTFSQPRSNSMGQSGTQNQVFRPPPGNRGQSRYSNRSNNFERNISRLVNRAVNQRLSQKPKRLNFQRRN